MAAATVQSQGTETVSVVDNVAVGGSYRSISGESGFTQIGTTDQEGNAYNEYSRSLRDINFFAEDAGEGNTFSTSGELYETFNASTTQSWNGARTVISNSTVEVTEFDGEQYVGESIYNTTYTFSAEITTSQQITTTQTNTVYVTTFTDTTNRTTRTGTVVNVGTDTKPSTTITQTEWFTLKTSNLSTTRITTTTQEDTYNFWGGDSINNKGIIEYATVVVLETSNFANLRPEIAWIINNRPEFIETYSDIAEQQNVSQFTVFPYFVTTQGVVVEGEPETEFGIITAPVFTSISETETTYITTNLVPTTVSVASSFTQIPSPLNEISTSTISTEEWFSTISETGYTGGDISTTTVFKSTTHQGRIGDVTWNDTHLQSSTIQTTFDTSLAFISTYSNTFSGETEGFIIDGQGSGEGGYTSTVTFERPISIVAQPYSPFVTRNQCGSSLFWAVAAASNASQVFQSIDANGVTAEMPPLSFAARTARMPFGTWTYITDGTTVTASADGAGLAVTSFTGGSNKTTSFGEWILNGDAVSTASLPYGQRINIGGVPPTGTATAFINAGFFYTSDSFNSGTLEITAAYTESIDPNAVRIAYLPATGLFIDGQQRYNTTARNITQTIAESAIITDRSHLIL